jgi:hypothetical protein
MRAKILKRDRSKKPMASKAEKALATVLFEYAFERIDFDYAADRISETMGLEREVVCSVLQAISREKNDDISEEELYQSSPHSWANDQYGLQDFRREWMNIFIWMRKYKNGEATKIQVGNATNWAFHVHETFSLDTLDQIKVNRWRRLLFLLLSSPKR